MFRTAPALLLFAAPLLLAAAPAAAASRWEVAANGAAIVLPAPAKAAGILGGSLFCREQRWALLLRTDRAAPAGASARIRVGEEEFSRAAEAGAGTLLVEVPTAILDSLKDGAGMGVAVGSGKDALSARFPLAGSRLAIEAAAPLCSPPDMTGFEAVPFQPAGAAIEAAQPLMAEELERFRASTTGAVPALSAALIDAEGGSKLLFASLCGSNRYYGETGCKLMGFASEAGGAWRPVYDTEGMHLFRDPLNARGGWPDLLTLTTAGGIERLRWAWDGREYRLSDDAALAGDPPAVLDGLRTGASDVE